MKDKNLSLIHPGEVLLEDFMKPLGLTQYRLAHDIGVTPTRISQIVNGERSITVDTAMRPARYLSQVPPFGFACRFAMISRSGRRS